MFIFKDQLFFFKERFVFLSFTDQVVFLPGFGCLYVHVAYERGTLVLSLAPEGGVEAVINQHRYCFL